MKNKENKKLVKELLQRLKQNEYKELPVEKITVIKKPRIDKRYVTDKDYKELVVLYEHMKSTQDFSYLDIEATIMKHKSKFPFLFKCNESIYNFVEELYCSGPYLTAKEMSRQGKEIAKYNEDFGESKKN